MMMRLGSGCRQIVSIYGACFKQPHMALIYQYIPGGSLYKRIHGKDQRPLTYLEVCSLTTSAGPPPAPAPAVAPW